MQVSKSCSEMTQFFRVVNDAAAYPVLTLAEEVVGWEEGESKALDFVNEADHVLSCLSFTFRVS